MKKKTLNSVLLVLCIVIYSAIFIKSFKKNKAPEVNIPIKLNNSKRSRVKPNKNYDFQLLIPNRDPFLGKIIAHAKTKTSKVVVNKIAIPKPNKIVNWPQISYHGFVKSQVQNEKLVVLKINNEIFRKRVKALVNDIFIKKAYGDSILLRYKKEEKMFYR